MDEDRSKRSQDRNVRMPGQNKKVKDRHHSMSVLIFSYFSPALTLRERLFVRGVYFLPRRIFRLRAPQIPLRLSLPLCEQGDSEEPLRYRWQ